MLNSPQSITLSLRPRSRPLPADACVIAGTSARDWIDVLCGAGACLDACQGYIVPLSLRERTPGGILVVAGVETLLGIRSPRVQGFRLLGSRLLIPCQADLHPGLEPTEADALVHHSLALYHPSIGLVGFEEAERVTIAELLMPWRERESNFSWAHPGPEIQDRLYAITAMPVPRFDLLFEDVRGGIGVQPAEQLPPAPDEARESAIGRWRNQMKLRFLEALKKLSGGGGESRDAGWRRRLEAWTEDRVEALRRDQERELKRLLHLLKTDPDEGLKYALPLVSGPQRGIAPPGSKLPRRQADFNLGHLRGGHPGAPWVVDWQRHYELSRRYREAASREVRLGRHRRAAYIFAELLKDYREAANVLRQGKFFREAAVLYLKHLGNPLEGARCLREGGFLLEAIPILEKQKQYETVAKLYEELGDAAEAERCYRLAVSRCLAHGQTIKAATLLHRNLHAIDEALALLQSTWPKAADAGVCLQYELSLYEKLKQPKALIARMESVTEDHPADRALELMETLVRVARQTPDATARDAAERCSFTVAGRWLAAPGMEDGRPMMAVLRRLLPEDRLLVRDTARFTEQCDEARERRSKAHAVSSQTPLTWLDAYPMPNWVQWQVVEANGPIGILALGTATHGATLMRSFWDGSFQTQMLPSVSGSALSRCRLEGTYGALPEVISVLGVDSLEPATLSSAGPFTSEVRVENPPWVIDDGFLGMTYGGKGVAWVLQKHGKEDQLLVISSYSSMGDLIATHTISLPFVVGPGMLVKPVFMIYAREQIVFACGRHLVRFYRDRVETLEMAALPKRLSYSPLGRLQIAATYENGSEVFWGSENWGWRRSLNLAVQDPVMTFTRTGDVLAASLNRLDLLGYRQGEFVPLACERMEGDRVPLGLFPTETPNVYALVDQREVRLLRVKRS